MTWNQLRGKRLGKLLRRKPVWRERARAVMRPVQTEIQILAKILKLECPEERCPTWDMHKKDQGRFQFALSKRKSPIDKDYFESIIKEGQFACAMSEATGQRSKKWALQVAQCVYDLYLETIKNQGVKTLVFREAQKRGFKATQRERNEALLCAKLICADYQKSSVTRYSLIAVYAEKKNVPSSKLREFIGHQGGIARCAIESSIHYPSKEKLLAQEQEKLRETARQATASPIQGSGLRQLPDGELCLLILKSGGKVLALGFRSATPSERRAYEPL